METVVDILTDVDAGLELAAAATRTASGDDSLASPLNTARSDGDSFFSGS